MRTRYEPYRVRLSDRTSPPLSVPPGSRRWRRPPETLTFAGSIAPQPNGRLLLYHWWTSNDAKSSRRSPDRAAPATDTPKARAAMDRTSAGRTRRCTRAVWSPFGHLYSLAAKRSGHSAFATVGPWRRPRRTHAP